MSNPQPVPPRYDGSQQHPARRRGGAFDVRNVIAALLGFYGIVLVIMGLVADSAKERAKTGDLNANLWAGIVMAVVAAVFVVWTRLRPVIIE
jgi:drug/metabolite transporter (DMT)-like permease